MTYNISKLSDTNPTLVTELKKHCYAIIGLCQQVHREMGPFLNEYMYQEALDISLEENNIERIKEFYFSVTYIIKWANGDNWTNPMFHSVTVSSGSPTGITSNDGAVTFQGTYAPAALTAGDRTNLYLAANNGLYYPKSDGFVVNAFRAYFRLNDIANGAREFILHFGDDETTDVQSLQFTIQSSDNDTLYDLQGRSINAKAKPGLYISNGNKVVIK